MDQTFLFHSLNEESYFVEVKERKFWQVVLCGKVNSFHSSDLQVNGKWHNLPVFISLFFNVPTVVVA